MGSRLAIEWNEMETREYIRGLWFKGPGLGKGAFKCFQVDEMCFFFFCFLTENVSFRLFEGILNI